LADKVTISYLTNKQTNNNNNNNT